MEIERRTIEGGVASVACKCDLEVFNSSFLVSFPPQKPTTQCTATSHTHTEVQLQFIKCTIPLSASLSSVASWLPVSSTWLIHEAVHNLTLNSLRAIFWVQWTAFFG